MITIAIDPGANTGLAFFQDGKLYAATSLPHKYALPRVRRELEDGLRVSPVRIVGERPQVYAVGKGQADPNDLITLALKMGAFFGLADMYGVEHVELLPATWKRQLPKHVAGQRIANSLTSDERESVRNLNALSKTVKHNAIDAIGIGLFAVGRSFLTSNYAQTGS